MNPYTHLTMNERETIFLMYEQGETIGHISETLPYKQGVGGSNPSSSTI